MLILSAEMKAKIFERPDEFLNYMDLQEKSCLIIDVEMNGMGGFNSHENRQQAKQTGAVSYLTKPVDGMALLDTIQWALTSAFSNKANRNS